jgi:hypothetical protein
MSYQEKYGNPVFNHPVITNCKKSTSLCYFWRLSSQGAARQRQKMGIARETVRVTLFMANIIAWVSIGEIVNNRDKENSPSSKLGSTL